MLMLGMMVGSFLNVVIYRLPQIIKQQNDIDSAELTGADVPFRPTITLSTPRSRCPRCGHLIRWYENIPVLSYLLLRGKCSTCASPISLRYPIIEVITGIVFLAYERQWGIGFTSLAWATMSAMLLALMMTDWDAGILPKHLVFPLAWIGLLSSAAGVSGVLTDHAIYGAVCGYAVFWVSAKISGFKDNTLGIGSSEMLLASALGAWFGVINIAAVFAISIILGLAAGLIVRTIKSERVRIPAGSVLAASGILMAMIH